MFFSSVAHAQTAAGAQPGLVEQMVPLVVIFVIFYLLIIRPQSKRHKKHQDFVSSMKRGDSVLTSGGILGTIEGITDKWVTLEVAEGVRFKILRAQIAGSAKEANEEKP